MIGEETKTLEDVQEAEPEQVDTSDSNEMRYEVQR
jgi:hypothetical protein